MIKNCKMINFKRLQGELGVLTAIEAGSEVPFGVQRVYYITDVPQNVTRGFHSHRDLEQVLLCLNGEVKIRVKTPYENEIIRLRNDSVGLYIGHMVWREMFNFTPGSVLMVLASKHYDENDYIRDAQAYEREAREYFKEA
ncbi:dTDP-6-deoxy-3,4-keto-hexulose isomerase [Oscillospiraceae bacterium]|nr:dTDP-6-deoxy-3,4-keto-hexulose isomerase [Oscillospiraceae bacterium]BDF74470.1 dTDP-6-deoxy-3,4-keto-hexulose isomerase [Oscillospiraceae bacterium]